MQIGFNAGNNGYKNLTNFLVVKSLFYFACVIIGHEKTFVFIQRSFFSLLLALVVVVVVGYFNN